jgi:hypothetical protein
MAYNLKRKTKLFDKFAQFFFEISQTINEKAFFLKNFSNPFPYAIKINERHRGD